MSLKKKEAIEKHKGIIAAALSRFRGDGFAKANLEFSRMTPEQMQEPYGDSGLTRAEVLRNYADWERRVDAAAEWVKSLK